MTDLWESIFTPGPTAPLLKAANISFAALQTVLLALLLATYNIHCVVLSVLCAGLWWSVNWFAAELKAVQQREEQEKLLKKKKKGRREGEDGSDTEVDESSQVAAEGGKGDGRNVSASAEVEARERTAGELKKRTAAGELSEDRESTPLVGGGAQSQSSVSTEDEWEKVSEGEHEKDK